MNGKVRGLLCPGNETITLIKDICNPCGTDDGMTHCSIGCMDANYTQRKWLSITIFYFHYFTVKSSFFI